MRAGCAGSTITATRCGPVADECRAVEHDPGARVATAPARPLPRRARPAPPPCAARAPRQPGRRSGRRPASQSPPGRSETQRSTPGVEDSSSPFDERTSRPGASGPSGSRASPSSSARCAPSPRNGAAARRKVDLLVAEQRIAGLAVEAEARPRIARRASAARRSAPGRRPSPCWPASAGCGWGRRPSPRAASRARTRMRATLAMSCTSSS